MVSECRVGGIAPSFCTGASNETGTHRFLSESSKWIIVPFCGLCSPATGATVLYPVMRARNTSSLHPSRILPISDKVSMFETPPMACAHHPDGSDSPPSDKPEKFSVMPSVSSLALKLSSVVLKKACEDGSLTPRSVLVDSSKRALKFRTKLPLVSGEYDEPSPLLSADGRTNGPSLFCVESDLEDGSRPVHPDNSDRGLSSCECGRGTAWSWSSFAWRFGPPSVSITSLTP